MNLQEIKMMDLLRDLKENHHVVGIKTEFEAEGTRLEEALRLKEILTKAGLDLTIKIGGCEALKDMYDARSIGVNRIVAPIIETPYALQKFLACAQKAFPSVEGNKVDFLINIETKTAVENFDEMLLLPTIQELTGIVIGRVDLVGSLGLPRDSVDSEQIANICKQLLDKAKLVRPLECVIGGGVNLETLPFFDQLATNKLEKFETRKVIFDAQQLLTATDRTNALAKAVQFELLWLKNKRHFYEIIYKEDESRIEFLQSRYDGMVQNTTKK